MARGGVWWRPVYGARQPLAVDRAARPRVSLRGRTGRRCCATAPTANLRHCSTSTSSTSPPTSVCNRWTTTVFRVLAEAARASDFAAAGAVPGDGSAGRAPAAIRFPARFAMQYGSKATDESFRPSDIPSRSTARSGRRAGVHERGAGGQSISIRGATTSRTGTPEHPVDFEQRDGRVNRFRGHAVRRNIVDAHRTEILGCTEASPWAAHTSFRAWPGRPDPRLDLSGTTQSDPRRHALPTEPRHAPTRTDQVGTLPAIDWPFGQQPGRRT